MAAAVYVGRCHFSLRLATYEQSIVLRILVSFRLFEVL